MLTVKYGKIAIHQEELKALLKILDYRINILIAQRYKINHELPQFRKKRCQLLYFLLLWNHLLSWYAMIFLAISTLDEEIMQILKWIFFVDFQFLTVLLLWGLRLCFINQPRNPKSQTMLLSFLYSLNINSIWKLLVADLDWMVLNKENG